MLSTDSASAFVPLFAAVGCICQVQGRILLLKRAEGKSYPGYWGIPSGKVDENETPLRAMLREFFEETGILLSADNIKEFKTYQITTAEFSFTYTTYIFRAEREPSIRLDPKEHTRFGWYSPDDALRLQLVPDLDGCLRDIFPSLSLEALQLDLFTGYPSFTAPSTDSLEKAPIVSLENIYASLGQRQPPRISVSFGPPGAGKSTLFKAMKERNPAVVIVQDNTILRPSSHLNFFIRKAFLEEERSFFFHFQLESLLVRFKYTVEAPDGSVVDETIYTTLAYSRALYRLNWLKDYEYQIFYNHYLTYFNLLPKPALVYYVDCDTDTLQKRLKRRNRKHESVYSRNYVESLQDAFAEVAKELEDKHRFTVIKIDSSKMNAEALVDFYGLLS